MLQRVAAYQANIWATKKISKHTVNKRRY